MKKVHYILALFLSSPLFFAQKEKVAFYFGAELQPIVYKYQSALNINARSYLNDRVSLGGSFSFASNKYAENFGYPADRTRSNHIILNVLAQNDFINTEKVVFSTYLSTGLYLFNLVNPDEKTTEIVYNDIDGVWIANEYEVPRRLSRNIFYNVQAGLDFSVKLATITEEEVGIYLTSRAGYQFVFGKSDFVNGNQFTKPVFSLGITFKGNK
jgi:hypothetical protein